MFHDLSGKILIVDDDPFVRSVLLAALEEAGASAVRTCGSGEEALAIAPAFQPDIVLLDIYMPGRSGLSTWTALRPFLPPSARVIYLSARPETATLSEGVIGVIAKPFNPAAIASEIEHLLQGTARAGGTGARLSKLAAEYRGSLPATAQSIVHLRDRLLQAGWQTADAEALRAIIHNIAGTAGLFGLRALGETADRTERLLLDALKAGTRVDMKRLSDAVGALLAACDTAIADSQS